jgi:hypothetical protein
LHFADPIKAWPTQELLTRPIIPLPWLNRKRGAGCYEQGGYEFDGSDRLELNLLSPTAEHPLAHHTLKDTAQT